MEDRYAIVEKGGNGEVLEVLNEYEDAVEKRDQVAESGAVDAGVFRISFHETEGQGETRPNASDKFPLDSTPDDELVDALDTLPKADPDTVEQNEDGTGHFVMHCDEDEVDEEAVEKALREVGYERRGVFAIPNRVKQKFEPAG